MTAACAGIKLNSLCACVSIGVELVETLAADAVLAVVVVVDVVIGNLIAG